MSTYLGYEVTKISCAVPLNDEQWKAINFRSRTEDEDDMYDQLLARLEKIGAESIEYNGHFGQNFYFNCKTTFHANKIVRVLTRMINRHIKTHKP